MKSTRLPPPVEELLFSTALSAFETRNLQRQADVVIAHEVVKVEAALTSERRLIPKI